MSVSTETLPTSHASRQSLIDEIEAISTRARAEGKFLRRRAVRRKKPLEGAGAALAIAREQLAAFDEQSRLAEFKGVVANYRERYAHLRAARAKALRLAEIEAEQVELHKSESRATRQSILRAYHQRRGNLS